MRRSLITCYPRDALDTAAWCDWHRRRQPSTGRRWASAQPPSSTSGAAVVVAEHGQSLDGPRRPYAPLLAPAAVLEKDAVHPHRRRRVAPDFEPAHGRRTRWSRHHRRWSGPLAVACRRTRQLVAVRTSAVRKRGMYPGQRFRQLAQPVGGTSSNSSGCGGAGEFIVTIRSGRDDPPSPSGSFRSARSRSSDAQRARVLGVEQHQLGHSGDTELAPTVRRDR